MSDKNGTTPIVQALHRHDDVDFCEHGLSTREVFGAEGAVEVVDKESNH